MKSTVATHKVGLARGAARAACFNAMFVQGPTGDWGAEMAQMHGVYFTSMFSFTRVPIFDPQAFHCSM